MVKKSTDVIYRLPIAIHSTVKIKVLEKHPGIVLGISITGPNLDSDTWYTVRYFINGGSMSEQFLGYELELADVEAR